LKGYFLEIFDRTCPLLPYAPFGRSPADAIIISDLHLGSSLCQDKLLIEFLQELQHSEFPPTRLILNGDVFDSIDFRRLNKRHWKVLSLIRKLSDTVPITWVCGNHDGPADPISHLLGVDVRDEYTFMSGAASVLVLHGHQFDDFISMYPTITLLGDLLYRLLQWIDRTHRFARFAKSNTKVFLRCIEKIRVESVAYARSKNARIVCCGHTHFAEQMTEGGVTYVNGGCWTESPPTYLTIQDGAARLGAYSPPLRPEAAEGSGAPETGSMVASRELALN
jgi:UDP-2,3-diacylglucosamine pyrophosphatase LpxH